MQLPYVLRCKPKSFVVLAISTFAGFGLLLLSSVVGRPLSAGLMLLFLCCWVLNFLMGVVYVAGWFSGRYDKLEERAWNRQVW
jgi:hypothetical protein